MPNFLYILLASVGLLRNWYRNGPRIPRYIGPSNAAVCNAFVQLLFNFCSLPKPSCQIKSPGSVELDDRECRELTAAIQEPKTRSWEIQPMQVPLVRLTSVNWPMHRNANLCPPIVIEEDSYQLGYGIDHRNLGNNAEHLFTPPMQAAWGIEY